MAKKLLKTIFTLMGVSLSFSLASCSSLDGNNGSNGKDASIKVGEEGKIYINDEPTDYYFQSKDCFVSIDVEHGEFGSVSGGGYYSYGSGIILTATPNEKGIFIGWKDKNGSIISKDKELLIVVDHNQNSYTAIFAANPEIVKANINIKIDESSLPNASYEGEKKVNLTTGVDLIFSNYEDKSLTLYTLDKDTYVLDSSLLNEKIATKELIGKSISYEEHISLYDGKTNYFQEETDFYFYVTGKPSLKVLVDISSTSKNGLVLFSDGSNASSSKKILLGSVLKLEAAALKKDINGYTYELSRFEYWEIDGERVSSEPKLTYTVWNKTNIVAHFTSSTKLTLTITSGEAGLKRARYQDCLDVYLASGSINGRDFEVNLDFNDGKALLELGYFNPGEVFSLRLKLFAKLNKIAPTSSENVWKFINISYYLSSDLIGKGNSLLFYVPKGTNDESNIDVKYIRTINYYTDATKEDGTSANEKLYGSGFGLFD